MARNSARFNSHRGFVVRLVVDVRRRPDLLETIADRVVAAFWMPADRPRITAWLHENLHREESLPCMLVAVDQADGRYLGSVGVIHHDLDERPDLSPWLAALWVEEAEREQGVGESLVEAAKGRARAAGASRLYLASQRRRQVFYAKRGWTSLEENVGCHRLTVMVHDL